jgi:hypothetical protein
MFRHDAIGFAYAKKKPEQTKFTAITGEHLGSRKLQSSSN